MRSVQGWALGEMILATLIIGGVFAMSMKMTIDYQADTAARTQGESSTLFADAAQKYFVNNQDAMRSAMADGTGASDYCMVGADATTGAGGTVSNDTTLHTCALDVSWLKYKGAIAAGFSERSGRASRWVAIFRRIYVAGSPTDDVEMLVVMARDGATFEPPAPPSTLAVAAEAGGASGGYVPGKDMGTCVDKKSTTTYQACGTGSGWKVDLSSFISATELNTFANALPN